MDKLQVISKQIDDQVKSVVSSKAEGFQKAFILAKAVNTIQDSLSAEYMEPIMRLQGSSLGFKTDRDIDPKTKRKGSGYPIDIVKRCVIEAVLLGLEPTNNQFNIIGGNMYPTREGFGYLLSKIPGLRYNIQYSNIVKDAASKTATINAKVDYLINEGSPKKQILNLSIKSDSYTSYDAIIGKAERKARRWLFNTIKGTDISDGDVTDIEHVDVTDITSDKLSELQNLFVDKEHLITSIDIKASIERIISKKEIASYDKAIKLLSELN